ncbi:MAG: tyrosine--tRNA ligase [Patescibacteria group bacterium]|nr:tyrosine--tRNA ligase [Patescibacteria group bacterium]
MDTKLINQILARGVTNIIPSKNSLTEMLLSGKKLNVYLGIDPTATQIHIGHAVPLRKLSALSKLGHNVTFLIGDFTALIGDTSDKTSERPILSQEQVQENFKTYKAQAEKVCDFSNIKIRYNSEWLSKLNFVDIIKLAQNFSVGDFIGRELIKKRLQEGKRVRLDETLYPVMQGYDSYFLNTDIQIGGADQTFNMQAGRILQKNLRGKESYILVTNYLLGTNGAKMSKSLGNAIWLNDPPDEMYGKIMSITDSNILAYFEMATNLPDEEIRNYKERLEKGENPMKIKKSLAHQIVSELHSEKEADLAQQNFENIFQRNNAEFRIKIKNQENLLKTLAQIDNLSNSEIKRLLSKNAIEINGKVENNPFVKLSAGDKVRIGKRKFVQIV